jgi:hypothetical protein
MIIKKTQIKNEIKANPVSIEEASFPGFIIIDTDMSRPTANWHICKLT